MNNKGQISWLWATILSIFALAVIIGLWIVVDESQTRLKGVAYQNTNLDLVGAGMFGSVWAFLPVILLASWGLYVWVMASATRSMPE